MNITEYSESWNAWYRSQPLFFYLVFGTLSIISHLCSIPPRAAFSIALTIHFTFPDMDKMRGGAFCTGQGDVRRRMMQHDALAHCIKPARSYWLAGILGDAAPSATSSDQPAARSWMSPNQHPPWEMSASADFEKRSGKRLTTEHWWSRDRTGQDRTLSARIRSSPWGKSCTSRPGSVGIRSGRRYRCHHST